MIDVLIIDDDAGQLDLFKTVFELNNFKVETALSGEEGLVKALQNSPSLIMLDFAMSGMSGLELLKKIKSEPGLVSTKVVLMTNMTRSGLSEEAISLGADDFILKADFTPKEMLKRVQGLITKS